MMEEIDTCLPRLPYWDKLSAAERALVRASAVIRRYERGRIIHGGAEECLGQIYILRGETRTYIVSDEGREISLFRLRQGDACVLSASCVISQLTFETLMTAERDCEILVVGNQAFAQLTERNIYVRCFQYERATERFSAVMQSLQQILFLGFDRRLAAFLVGEYDRSGARELRMTHEQIAQQVSSAREVVARMLKRFAADGLVETERGVIRLTDVARLRALI